MNRLLIAALLGFVTVTSGCKEDKSGGGGAGQGTTSGTAQPTPATEPSHAQHKRLPIGETTVGGRPAIVPEISGRAWITGTSQVMLDPDDPWPAGYRLADTWPRKQ